VVEVQDPYQLNGPQANNLPLKFGRFVAAEITGIQASNIVKLPRFVLRLDGTVLTVDTNSEININTVEVIRTDEDFVYIGGGLDPEHQVILSAVSSPYNGMPVRILPEKSEQRSESGEEVNL
jgi:hypothetical protein